MNLLKQLEILRKDKSKEFLVKRYLLECCGKLSRFRSDETFSKNMEIAQKFLRGVATKKQMHDAEWEMEGQAFGAEHYSENGIQVYFRADANIRKDLLQVIISKGLGNKEAREYLIEMAYFIDGVFCYLNHPSNWLFNDTEEKFLCARLFKRYFRSV